LIAVSAAKASAHVRLVMPLSVPARYALPLEIQGGLLLGLILGVDDLHGGPTVGRVEAGALTQAGVVAVELSSPAAPAD
jgi:hypothetical protein